MVRFLLGLLVVTNILWFVLAEYQTREYDKVVKASEVLYYENYANDHAATECAEKTGFRYNCADGSQKVSCDQ